MRRCLVGVAVAAKAQSRILDAAVKQFQFGGPQKCTGRLPVILRDFGATM
jgi:hypothetical protein